MDADILIGCDFHARFQQVAWLERATGEIRKRRLEHTAEAEAFYRGLAPGAEVGIEAGAPAPWFERLLAECGHKLRVGDAAKFRRQAAPGRKNDERDAALLLDLLAQSRFPDIWWPDQGVRDRRNLVLHRHGLVKMRVRVVQQLKGMARGHGLLGRQRGLTRELRAGLEALPLPPHTARRRRALLDWHDRLTQEIAELQPELERLAASDPASRLLLSHPGVGPVTAVYLPLVIGDPARFPSGDALANYLGLSPGEHSSGETRRLGPITRQGNRLARWLLLEAAQTAARLDPELQHFYARLALRRGRQKAKVAVARKLAVRLLLMWRRGVDYRQWTAATARAQAGPASTMSRKG